MYCLFSTGSSCFWNPYFAVCIFLHSNSDPGDHLSRRNQKRVLGIGKVPLLLKFYRPMASHNMWNVVHRSVQSLEYGSRLMKCNEMWKYHIACGAVSPCSLPLGTFRGIDVCASSTEMQYWWLIFRDCVFTRDDLNSSGNEWHKIKPWVILLTKNIVHL